MGRKPRQDKLVRAVGGAGQVGNDGKADGMPVAVMKDMRRPSHSMSRTEGENTLRTPDLLWRQ